MHDRPRVDSRQRRPGRLAFSQRRRRSWRRGVLTLELVLVLPLMLIALVAIIQFGQYFMQLQELAFAARVGAEEAAVTTPLPDQDGDPVPASVVAAVDQQLACAGIGRRLIVLEHNVSGGQITLVSPSGSVPPKLAAVPPGRYVRLIVVVPKGEVMPGLLNVFGLQLTSADQVAMSQVIMCYER